MIPRNTSATSIAIDITGPHDTRELIDVLSTPSLKAWDDFDVSADSHSSLRRLLCIVS